MINIVAIVVLVGGCLLLGMSIHEVRAHGALITSAGERLGTGSTMSITVFSVCCIITGLYIIVH